MKKTFWFVALVAMALSFSACTSDDEDGENMEWEAEVYGYYLDDNSTYVYGVINTLSKKQVRQMENTFETDFYAKTYYFKCTNYSNIWIESVVDQANDITYTDIDDSTFKGQRYSVSLEGSTLCVDLLSNVGFEDRDLLITVSAGEVSYQFHFYQEAENILWL